VTNSSQSVTASLTLSAFGQTVASSGSSTSAYQFGATSGYRTDGDAGLTLVGCRFYDAQVGRFITRDTYLDQAPYAYCDGDPVNAMDPSGHKPPPGKNKPPAPKPPAPKPPPYPVNWPKKYTLGFKAEVAGVGGEGTGEFDPVPIWNHMRPGERDKVKNSLDMYTYIVTHQAR